MAVKHCGGDSTQDFYSVDVAGVNVQVTVTSRAKIVRKWLVSRLYICRKIAHLKKLVVGLGVEPTGADIPAKTLQMCFGSQCLIFQLSRAKSVPRKLRRFMKSRAHSFVGFENGSDRWRLKRSKHHLKMRKEPLDLTDHAEMDELQALETVKGREMSNNWKREHLSLRQVEYATVNAYTAHILGKNIEAWNM